MYYSYKNDLSELPIIIDHLCSFCKKNNIIDNLRIQLELVVEEVFCNIISYACAHLIDIDYVVENNILKIQIKDDGLPFDPVSYLSQSKDPSDFIDDKPIGGLGLFLVQKTMDNLNYSRSSNKNIFSLAKKL